MRARVWMVSLGACTALWMVSGSDAEAQDNSYQVWHRRGVKALKTRSYERALEAFRAAVLADPNQLDGYFNAGSVARHLGRCRDVLLYFRGFLYLSPGTEDDRAARAALEECERKGETGRVSVQSDPPGAEVLVNGVLVGQAPMPDLVLPRGDLTMEFRHPDCEVLRETITVRAEEPARVAVRLPRKPAFGFLEVVTSPREGVTVWVNEEQVGVTPLEKVRMTTGKVLVRLEKTGYDPWVRAVVIEKDRTYRLEAVLEKSDEDPQTDPAETREGK